MKGTLALVLLIASLVPAVFCHVEDRFEITTFTPGWGHVHGREIVRVHGCGFRAFSEATCIWNHRWPSVASLIVTDNTIICETPPLLLSDFDSLPQIVSLEVYFDGNNEDLLFEVGEFYYGPSAASFAPTFGFVGGGETLFIQGKGFNDFTSVNVTLDGRQCTGAAFSDEYTIRCKVPPGEFNENAIVEVYFQNNPKYFLRFDETYHYGPFFTQISPTCGNYLGGTKVTLFGENMDDPAIAPTTGPVNVNPIVEIIYNGGTERTYGINATFNPFDKGVVFYTPFIGADVLGETVEIDVFFKDVQSKVGSFVGFTYGPQIFSTPAISPSLGHVGGGEQITIHGCGFEYFNTTDVSVTVDGTPLCQPASVQLIDGNLKVDDILTCTTGPVGCFDNGVVDVQFTSGNGNADFTGLFFQTGPTIDVSSMSPVRGPRVGGTLVTIHGKNFFRARTDTAAAPGWAVRVNFDSGDVNVVIPSVLGTIKADDLISFRTPLGLFDLDVVVSFEFGTGTVDSFTTECDPETNGEVSFHYGPVCESLSITNGHWSGGDHLVITGEGFTEDNTLLEDIEVRFCLTHLPLGGFFYDSTCAFQNHEREVTFDVTDDEITLTTPDNRQNVSTCEGSNRLFGDHTTVWVHFLQPGGDGDEFPRNQLRPGLEVARIQCPQDFIFGPVVDHISPRKGSIGPTLAQSTSVSIIGSAFVDPQLDKDNIRVYFDLIESAGTTVVSDTTIVAKSPVVESSASNTEVSVDVVFDTCNETFSGVTHGWGPAIYSVEGPYGDAIVNQYNPHGHIYGIHYEGGETVTLHGERFSDFYDDDVFYGQCYIDGNAVPTGYVDDSTIECETLPNQFGKTVNIALKLGLICGAEFEIQIIDDGGVPIRRIIGPSDGGYLESHEPFDWRHTLVAHQKLVYSPRVDYITPTYGHTSGGEPVVLHGEGFTASYFSFECFFGHYSDQVHAEASIDGTTVACHTPRNRAEFNTDVHVHVQLDADDDDDNSRGRQQEDYPGVEDGDKKVFSPEKFHYGPVCNDIQFPVLSLSGQTNVALKGSGFADCVNSNVAPFSDCVFNQFQVYFVDPISGARTLVSSPTNRTGQGSNTDTQLLINPPPADCGFEPIVEIEFFTPLVSSDVTSRQHVIQCKAPDSRSYFVHYGPVFSGQVSEFYQSGVSYGFTGDAITIQGRGFNDVPIFRGFGNIQCYVGNALGTVDFVSNDGTSLRCVVPSGTFDSLVDVRVEWSGSSKSCTGTAGIHAQKFHYGPVIRSITPTRGYVNDQTPVTISGFAFGCCGIKSYQCQFPETSPPWVDDSKRVGLTDTVTCSVPVNTAIDTLINNVGLGFAGDKWSGLNKLYLAEDKTSLTFYYGPYVTSIVPQRLSLSGRDEALTIYGEGFADPYLLEAFCDFISTTGAADIIPTTPLEKSNKTDTYLICPVPQFCRACGSIDGVRPRWRRDGETLRPEQGRYYYKTVAPTATAVNKPPFFSDGGSLTPAYVPGLKYGPVILSVCVGDLCDDELPRSSLAGGTVITVQFDNLRDWVSDTDHFDFGNEVALCVFGNRRAAALSAILADPDNNDIGTVLCVSPPGGFDTEGEISVILDPKLYSETGVTAENGWHWLPYADHLNANYGHEHGHEAVVVRGAGFCNYDRVLCLFDGRDARQADIINDYMVQCSSPPHLPKSKIPVELVFCELDWESGCGCTFWGSQDKIAVVTSQFDYLGVTGIVPSEGPVCGSTSITVRGVGFSNFDSMQCNWGLANLVTSATIVNDTAVVCASPDYSPRFESDFVQCVEGRLIASRGGRKETLNWPVKFEMGYPQVLSITPATADIDELPTTLDLRGIYFGGGVVGSIAQCQFVEINVTTQGVIQSIPGGASWDRRVLCNLPAASLLTVGDYTVEVKYPCSKFPRFSDNRQVFTITQTPVISGFDPKEGPEIGGQTVTITGQGFNGGSMYLCSFGDIDNGNNLLVSAKLEANLTAVTNLQQITCKTPFFPNLDQQFNAIVAISLDGGETFIRSRDRFKYENVRVAGVDQEFCDAAVSTIMPFNGFHTTTLIFSMVVAVALAFLREF